MQFVGEATSDVLRRALVSSHFCWGFCNGHKTVTTLSWWAFFKSPECHAFLRYFWGIFRSRAWRKKLFDESSSEKIHGCVESGERTRHFSLTHFAFHQRNFPSIVCIKSFFFIHQRLVGPTKVRKRKNSFSIFKWKNYYFIDSNTWSPWRVFRLRCNES